VDNDLRFIIKNYHLLVLTTTKCTQGLVYTIKSKAFPLHAMEALGGRGGIAPAHS
jgi:hypothetical protein